MATGYLIDTNVLIDAQMNRLPPDGSQLLAEIIDEDFTVSFVTYIASTALSRNLNLITRNVDDFKKIKGLKVINLYEL
ncbi:PIN domain-containing protein [Parapedobacter koreensis]|uniref:PIN domain-containing protein n=1 Tax=Parapedobacter koreensis TaxID=332977 RepID=A0A1H7SEJ2_9SPHI|nr:hypothetical protein [Parapedobacter koreensis]SEL69947.1 hypothetical protein SAMN05421740_108206 [Parapedobacter koreensis]